MKKLVSISLSVLLLFSLSACGNTAKTEDNNANNTATPVEVTGDPVKIGKVDAAPHGDKAFGFAVAMVQGDKIIGAYIDEYQFMPKADVAGVPNSDQTGDGAFASNFKDASTTVLASKRTNADYYSNLMKSNAGSTVTVGANYDAIQNFVVGKTIAELEAEISGKDAKGVTDAVSGATLVDTKGYVEALIEAAKAAK